MIWAFDSMVRNNYLYLRYDPAELMWQTLHQKRISNKCRTYTCIMYALTISRSSIALVRRIRQWRILFSTPAQSEQDRDCTLWLKSQQLLVALLAAEISLAQ